MRHQDPVTQLPTRTAFLQRLRRIVEPLDAIDADASPEKVLVGHIDLRNLALVRSAYSPETCTRLLRALADRLRQWVGPTDLLALLEGDRFCFALRCDAAVGNQRLDDLEDLLARPVQLDAAWIHVASVVGVSMYAGGQSNAAALLDQAAVAASTAMPIETNPVRIYQPAHSEQTRLWADFQRSFPRDLAEQRVFPMYQPQIDAVSGGARQGSCRLSHAACC
jgi:GGDEF domain-containing protein